MIPLVVVPRCVRIVPVVWVLRASLEFLPPNDFFKPGLVHDDNAKAPVFTHFYLTFVASEFSDDSLH